MASIAVRRKRKTRRIAQRRDYERSQCLRFGLDPSSPSDVRRAVLFDASGMFNQNPLLSRLRELGRVKACENTPEVNIYR